MFSIVTITYNNLVGLKKTATSVIEQTCKDYEWIIIDGASTDGTQDYLDDLKVSYSSEPDKGIYDAMNKGLARAHRQYIVFMNAGDIFAASNTLDLVKSAIEKTGHPDLLYGPALESRPDSETGHKSPLRIKFLAWGLPTHHQALYYKTSLAKAQSYNTYYKIAADYDFTCRFMKQTKTVHIVSFPLCLFEPGGLSQQQVKAGRLEQYYIRKKLNICSPLKNNIIYALQTLSMTVRQISPHLYWTLRSFGMKK
jgi:putative colanic acid biosynthesis glycosyltransferase